MLEQYYGLPPMITGSLAADARKPQPLIGCNKSSAIFFAHAKASTTHIRDAGALLSIACATAKPKRAISWNRRKQVSCATSSKRVAA